ncbi:phosphatase PAP2 family protein [Nicoletella semolina]|nr:phosphatase PAP2 family protein [Nicoletella semolina]
MLVIPLATWGLSWQWTTALDYQDFDGDFWLFILTETGSVPYALITCVVFMLWIMWLVRKHYSWLLVGVMCASSVVGTQLIKEGAKAIFKEPRPFVSEIFINQSEAFYRLSKTEQREALIENYPLPHFVAHHQAKELGYSFPSGHTIFAVSWLLLFGGFLAGLRGKAVVFAQIFAIVWSGLMLISRLRLGMHYPIDLLASTLISWGFHLVFFIWYLPRVAALPIFNLGYSFFSREEQR